MAAAAEPADQEVTKKQAVQMLMGDIRAMQRKGFTMDRIAGVLSENGLSISGALLSSYVYRIRAGDPGARTKRGRARAGHPADQGRALPAGRADGGATEAAATLATPGLGTDAGAASDAPRGEAAPSLAESAALRRTREKKGGAGEV